MAKTVSRRARASTRLKQLNYRARARIYLKDPLEAERNPRLYGNVVVSRDSLITTGPTSSRFIVIDYDPQTDRVERPARSKLVTAGTEKMLEFPYRRGSPQEAQVTRRAYGRAHRRSTASGSRPTVRCWSLRLASSSARRA